ncbi:MAG: response regulator [bacterium]|nr:response regulator [bacterium]
MKFLVAEDYEMVREMLAYILVNAGHDVVLVKNGRDAWKVLENGEKIDYILSEVDMPEMNGVDLLRKVKTDSRTKNISFIMIGGIDLRPVNETVSIQAICDAYGALPLEKPFEQNRLLSFVNSGHL